MKDKDIHKLLDKKTTPNYFSFVIAPLTAVMFVGMMFGILMFVLMEWSSAEEQNRYSNISSSKKIAEQEAAFFIQQLNSSNATQRCNAAQGLEQIVVSGKSKELAALVNPLIGALQDDDIEVRRYAVRVLGHIKDHSAVGPLVVLLRGNQPILRREAALALGEIKDSAAVIPLAGALGDEDSITSQNVALALRKCADEKSREIFLNALMHTSPKVLGPAIDALGILEEKRALEQFQHIVKNPQMPFYIIQKVQFATNKIVYGFDSTKLPIVNPRGLESQRNIDNWNETRSSRYPQGFAPLEALIDDIHDESLSWNVRASVAEALGKKKDHRAINALGDAFLKSNDSSFRRVCARALGIIGDKKAFSFLVKGLDDKNEPVCEDVIEAIGAIGGTEAISILSPLLGEEKKWFIKEAAAKALGNIGLEQAVGPLIDFLRSKQWDASSARTAARGRAAEALIKINSSKAIKPLLTLAHLDVRAKAAISALKGIQPKLLQPLLNFWMLNDNYFYNGEYFYQTEETLLLRLEKKLSTEKYIALVASNIEECRIFAADQDVDVCLYAVNKLIAGLESFRYRETMEQAKQKRTEKIRIIAETLFDALNNTAEIVKMAAIRGLLAYSYVDVGDETDDVVVRGLAKALTDSSDKIRLAALNIFPENDGQNSSTAARWSGSGYLVYDMSEERARRRVRALSCAFNDHNDQVRLAAINACGPVYNGNMSAVHPPSGKCRIAVIEEVLGPIINIAKNIAEKVDIRLAAVGVLQYLGDPRAEAVLDELKGDPVEKVRMAAAVRAQFSFYMN